MGHVVVSCFIVYLSRFVLESWLLTDAGVDSESDMTRLTGRTFGDSRAVKPTICQNQRVAPTLGWLRTASLELLRNRPSWLSRKHNSVGKIYPPHVVRSTAIAFSFGAFASRGSWQGIVFTSVRSSRPRGFSELHQRFHWNRNFRKLDKRDEKARSSLVHPTHHPTPENNDLFKFSH